MSQLRKRRSLGARTVVRNVNQSQSPPLAPDPISSTDSPTTTDDLTMSELADMPLTLTIEEAAKVLRIGRSAAYAAARTGELPTIRLGRCLRVPRARLEQMLKAPNLARAACAAENHQGGDTARKRA